jgi:hypothetical protein
MTNKKLVERDRLMSLLRCIGLQHLEPEPGESPDFTLHTDNRSVGVEVTRLVSTRAPDQDNPSQSSRLLDALVERILAYYTEAGGPPVHASLSFRDGLRIRKAEITALARDLAALLVDQLREVRTRPVPVEIHLDHYGLLTVAIWPRDLHIRPLWHRTVSGMVDTARPEDILRTLAGKERKIAQYRKRADEIWALIVCDFMASGLFIDPPEEPVPFQIASRFDRLFCLAWSGAHAVEVPLVTQRSAPAA